MSAGDAAIADLRAAFNRPLSAYASSGSIVGLTAASVPAELVAAAGLSPVLLRWQPAPTPAADRVLEPGVFSARIRALVEAALTGGLDPLAALVIPRSSEQDYKAYLYLRELARDSRRGVNLPPLIFYDLLQSSSPGTWPYALDRTRELASALGRISGRRPSDDDLMAAIDDANRARAAVRRLLALRRDQPRVRGAEIVPLIGAVHVTPAGAYALLADAAASRLAPGQPLASPRLLLAGAPVDHLTWHEAIEGMGATVVAEDSAWGSRAAGADVDDQGDPLTAIASKYYMDGDGTRRSRDLMDAWLAHALDDVDGVMFWLPPEDSVYGWEYPRLGRLVDGRGLPHLVLRHESPAATDGTVREQISELIERAATRKVQSHGR